MMKHNTLLLILGLIFFCGANAYATPPCSLPNTPTSVTPPNPVCTGNPGNYMVSAVGGATSYSWTVTGAGWSGSGTSATTSISLTAGSETGTITVTAVNACGPSSAYTVMITPQTVPSAPVEIDTPSLICNGLTATFETPAVTGVDSFTWAVGGTGWSENGINTSTGSSSSDNIITVNIGNGDGTLSVSAVNVCGSGPSLTINNIVAGIVPIAPVISSSSIAPCAGSAISYSVAPLSNTAYYSWSVTGSGWTEGTSVNDTINMTAGTNTGTISVFAVNECGDGPATSLQVTPDNIPGAPTSIITPALLCTNSTGIFSTDSITNTTGYTWTVNGAGWSGSSDSSQIMLTAGTGTLTLTVSAVNICGTSAPFTLNNYMASVTPTATFSLSNQLIYTNANEILTYTGNAPTGSVYTWDFDGGVSTSDTGVGSHAVTWAATGVKHITLTVSDSSGCSSVFTDSVLVTAPTNVQSPNMNNLQVNVLPNPNNGVFDISFNQPVGETFIIKIVDMQGRIVYSRQYTGSNNNRVSVNAQELPDGIYNAMINIEGNVINRKIVVAK